MRPLTVLHLAANRWWTGSADPTIQLVAALRARGHRVLLGVTPGDRFEAKAKEAGLDLVAGLRLSTRVAPFALAGDLACLRRLVRSEGVELIHTHHSHDHWLAWAVHARRPDGRPLAIVRSFHNARAVKRGRLSATLYRRTAAAFAVSREVEARCLDAGFPPERVRWMPGVADLARFDGHADPAPVREEFKLGEAPVIACVSRLAVNRGHEALLAGFRRVLDTVPAARLLLVGKGETRARLEQLVAELGLGERVIFTGYRDRDLPAVLAAADGFALMGAGSDESCRAALEAMAAARCVVARRVGALPETVVDGETGILLDDDAPDTLARALATVLGDRVRARLMGQAGRRRVEEMFSPAHAAAIVEPVYLALR